MKHIKWKSLFLSCMVCALTVPVGVILWERLPDLIPVHFNLNNEPDNFASKGFAVFGIPFIMIALQIFSCVTNDINAYKYEGQKKFENIAKWIIPVLTIFLQTIIFAYSMGVAVDMRRMATLIIGIVFIISGIYIPKLDYVKNKNIDKFKAKKINRFIGTEALVMGILFIISLFFPPFVTMACIILLIPYGIASIIYSIVIEKKK